MDSSLFTNLLRMESPGVLRSAEHQVFVEMVVFCGLLALYEQVVMF
jgi:hypothetical protein